MAHESDLAGRSSRRITLSLPSKDLIITECITVTSAMRKHARWKHSSVAAILGGGTTKQAPSDRRPAHSRYSSGSTSLGEEEDAPLSRWGQRGKKGRSLQDDPLLSAFARLRSDLKNVKDIRTFDTPALLHPFLQVIRSSSTNAPITSLALMAITKMLDYDVIGPESLNFAHAMLLLSSTITHCRFEGSNDPTDEVVFLRILQLMENMVCGPCGDVLGDQSVCEMMECGLSICCHQSMHEVIRRSAEISMVKMCQRIFQTLKDLGEESGEEPEALEETVREDMDNVKIDSSASGAQAVERRDRSSLSTSLEAPKSSTDGRPSQEMNSSQLDLSKDSETEETPDVRPYSLPSIRELFRVLADLLDPHDRTHTDTMRVMALRIVNVALEVAGPAIAYHPSLASLAKDTLCRNLFQLVRSENVSILHESLRVAGTLLATCRTVLKLQQELYLSYVVACLHPRVPIPDEPAIDPALFEGVPQAPKIQGPPSGRGTPVPVKDRRQLGMEGGSRKPDAREAMVESVGALMRIPSFMVELFVNYDCEVDRSDLCVDMVGLLARNAFPDSATWSTTNVPPLCLDSLLGYVQFIADRLEDEPQRNGLPDRGDLKVQRARKSVIIRGATKFNERPKDGLAYLASQGEIKDPSDTKSVAEFLKGTTRIDKKVLGEYLSKRGNEALLDNFIDMFDFTGQRVDEALRQMLNTFRLPGEAQLIDKIVQSFTEKYWASGDHDEIAEKDAVYVLSFAIIMLNTDQHNPNLKSQARMTAESFARNLRGVNGGKDFPEEYLQDIYNAIKTREIILPEEHDNKHAFDYAWSELLLKTDTASNLVRCDTNIYDAEMFAATWRPVVATLNYVFLSATDDTVFQRVIAGFDQCAQIAAKYELYDCLDHIIFSLSRISGLATDSPPSTVLNTEVQEGDKSIMVSKFAVDFGRENKSELATLVLFRIINGHEGAIRDGWQHIVRIFLNLFVNSLIPNSFSSLTKTLDLPPIPLQSPVQVIERNDKSNDIGLFSAFTTYVASVMNDEPPEPNREEIEATLCTVDCINACRLEDIFANISKMPVASLKSLTASLLAHIPEDSSPRVIVVKPEVPAPTPVRPNGVKPQASKPTYDPAFVCVLELATVLAMRDTETLAELGKEVAEALQLAVRDADRSHEVTVGRTAYYLLSLLKASDDHGYIRAPVVLHTFSSFNEDLLRKCAQPILRGILECVEGPKGLRNEMAMSPDFWSLLHTLQRVPEAASIAFQIAEEIATGTPSAITADNYEPAILLLNGFATAGSVGAAREQPRGQPARRGKPATPVPEPRNQAKSDAVLRGVKAMNIVYQMTTRVPGFIQLSHLEPNEAWQAYWYPIFRCLIQQSQNPCREIRQQAFGSLARCLLSNDLASEDHKEWTNIFGKVLFPLIHQLLKPEVYQSDPQGMGETRIYAAQLLCKVFLHYLELLTEWAGMLDLWVQILEIMDRLMNSGRSDTLQEAVPESLKNILLVMSSDGFLVPPTAEGFTSPDKEKLWTETSTRLNRFLPGLMDEVFPKQPEPPAPKRSTNEVEEGEKQDSEKNNGDLSMEKEAQAA